MWQYLRGKTYGDTVSTLSKQQWELNRQGHRLLLSTVVRQHPLCGLLVVDYIEGKLREARLDITTCSSLVTRKDVTPVTLHIDKKSLLTKLHQGILDRGITMWVVLHSLTHNISHLVVAAILHALHGV